MTTEQTRVLRIAEAGLLAALKHVPKDGEDWSAVTLARFVVQSALSELELARRRSLMRDSDSV